MFLMFIYKDDKTTNDCNDDILNIVVRWVYILYIVEGYKSNLLLSLRIAKGSDVLRVAKT